METWIPPGSQKDDDVLFKLIKCQKSEQAGHT